MQYKTIVLGLLEQQPELYASLAANRTLLSTMNRLAAELAELHVAMIAELKASRPEASDLIIKSEALELAIGQLQQSLPLAEP